MCLEDDVLHFCWWMLERDLDRRDSIVLVHTSLENGL